VARTNPTYPRTPLGGVYIPGAKSIEASTGDTARTTDGWIESEKFGWCTINSAGTMSYEFDTAVTRTGTRTLKVSTTNTSGRGRADGNTADTPLKYTFPIKPSTSYILRCFAKTTTVAADSVYMLMGQLTSADAFIATIGTTNKLTGTNDWTLLTSTFTTHATAAFGYLSCRNIVAGNISDAWFDVSGMTLVQTGVTRNALTQVRNNLTQARSNVV
jgi:hypothetical protein